MSGGIVGRRYGEPTLSFGPITLYRIDQLRLGLRMPINDSWIAATAMRHGIAVVTQDDDFPPLGGLDVVRV